MKRSTPLLEGPVVLREGDLSSADLDDIMSSSISAWDIETSGLDFRLEKIGTVQIADEAGRTWLVKIHDGERPDVICGLLADASRRKVFHFAPFDLTFMRFAWSARAQNVACTKVLHRLIDPYAHSHSLKHLLASELGVVIEKDESIRRSNWGEASLSSEQLRYAASDVAYLLPLYDTLMEGALRRGMSRIAERSFEYLPVRVETEMLGIEDLFAY